MPFVGCRPPVDVHEVLYETAGEVAATALVALGAGVVTLAGLLAEESSIQALLGGHAITALWYAYMGAIALYVGVYLLGYREVRPRVDRLRSAE